MRWLIRGKKWLMGESGVEMWWQGVADEAPHGADEVAQWADEVPRRADEVAHRTDEVAHRADEVAHWVIVVQYVQ